MRTRGRSSIVRNVLIGGAVLIAAGVAGWFWAPFGQPLAPDATPTTTAAAGVGSTDSPLAALEPGDCFDALDSAWASTYEPVSCEEPHTAQLTAIVPVASVLDGADAGWPGEEALRDRAMLACQSPDAIDLAGAAEIADLELQARWPVNEAEWDAGEQSYYCFAMASELFDSLQP